MHIFTLKGGEQPRSKFARAPPLSKARKSGPTGSGRHVVAKARRSHQATRKGAPAELGQHIFLPECAASQTYSGRGATKGISNKRPSGMHKNPGAPGTDNRFAEAGQSVEARRGTMISAW